MTNRICAHCAHELDPHEMIAVVVEPVPAGLVLCPTPGCGCTATWSANTQPPVPGLRESAIRAVRAELSRSLDGELLLVRLDDFAARAR